MPSTETRTVTVLVTDMAGSTAFRAKWGDAEADDARRRHVAAAKAAVSAREGQIIKGTGDGTLAIFASAAEAIGAAIAIQQRSIAERAEKHAPPIRIGLAAGDVSFEEGDCFGRPVIEASRLEADAAADGILATKLVELLAAGLSEATFRDRGEAELKGFPDPVPISEVRFDVPDSAPVASDAPVPISPTRLSPPGLASHTIARPRIERRLASALTHRIATVEAGAGYGKSTAAASYLLEATTPWCWLSCDRRLAQPVPLAAHVCAAIAKVYPGFGLDRWPEDGTELARTFAAQVGASIVEPPVVCVDDVHSLPDAVRGALLEMVARSAPLRWLLLSREPIAVSARAGLDAAGPITEVDLAFDQAEATDLLEVLTLGSGLSGIERIQAETEGWPAGLVLAARGASSSRRAGTDASFEYLADEALGALPEDLVDFLERLSLPYRFSPELATAITGRGDADTLIDHLLERHLFTIPLDAEGSWFRFHHLFRAFLRQRLESRSDIDPADLNSKLADGWLAADEPEEAVRAFLAAGDEESAARTLGPLLAAGSSGERYAALRPLLDAVPAEVRQRHASLLVAEAQGHLYEGGYEEAYREYERSFELLVSQGQVSQAAAVLWRYLGTMMTAGAHPARRMEVSERLLSRLSGSGLNSALAHMISAIGFGQSTRTDDAAALIQKALAIEESDLVRAYAWATRGWAVSYPRGDVQGAIAEVRQAIAFSQAHPELDPYALGPYSACILAALLAQVGRYDEAIVQAENCEGEFRRLGGTTGGISRAGPWYRLMARTGRGEWAQAEAVAGDPTEILRSRADIWSYRLAAPYSRLAAIRGDTVLAAELIRHGRKALTAEGRTMEGPMVLCEFAHAANAAGLGARRRSLAQEALRYAEESGLVYRRAQALLHCAACSKGSERDTHVAAVLALSQDHDYDFLWSQHERSLAGPLLGRALHLDDWRDYAADLAAQAGGEVSRECARAVGASPEAASALLTALLRSPDPDLEATRIASGGRLETPEVLGAIRTRPRAPLSFNGFGGLAVARSGSRLESPQLAAGAPSAGILARLLCAWPERVPVEVFATSPGPDASGSAVRERLDTDLTALEQALDPWAAHRDTRLVRLRGDAVGLELDDRDRVEFGALFAPEDWAGMSLARMKEIARHTEGEFLPEFCSADWARAAGERLERARIEFMIAFAERLRAEGQAGAAAERLASLVESDPDREELHRRLMRCYVDAGEPARALRQYHSLRAHLLNEHGIEPSAETRVLFDALV